MTHSYDTFFQLVRLGIGTSGEAKLPDDIDWLELKTLADSQELGAVVLDGIDRLNTNRPNSTNELPLQNKLEWIGEVIRNYEQRYKHYEEAIGSLAGFYNQHGFKMMVLKGYVCSLCWPTPNHRPCGDIDIWLFGQWSEADEALSKKYGVKIDRSHHHHTVFEWEGFAVEDHYDFVNVHAHKSSEELEAIFKELGADDSNFIDVNGGTVYLPAHNLHALFLIKHMVSHFAAANITLRQVLDWAFFAKKHTKEIDWEWLTGMLTKFHMTEFYNCINAICVGDLGFDVKIFPNVQFVPTMKDRVLKDILSPAYTAVEPRGIMKRVVYKYRRWQANAWKQAMCYEESRWTMFWAGVWNHLLKPRSI